jgi:hypothetical protein
MALSPLMGFLLIAIPTLFFVIDGIPHRRELSGATVDFDARILTNRAIWEAEQPCHYQPISACFVQHVHGEIKSITIDTA